MDIFELLESDLGSKAPEIRGEIKDARKRIQEAKDLFNKHFDDDGNPKTARGRSLFKKYEVGEHRVTSRRKYVKSGKYSKSKSVLKKSNRK